MKEDRTGGASGAKTYRMEAREARGWAVPRLRGQEAARETFWRSAARGLHHARRGTTTRHAERLSKRRQ